MVTLSRFAVALEKIKFPQAPDLLKQSLARVPSCLAAFLPSCIPVYNRCWQAFIGERDSESLMGTLGSPIPKGQMIGPNYCQPRTPETQRGRCWWAGG